MEILRHSYAVTIYSKYNNKAQVEEKTPEGTSGEVRTKKFYKIAAN